MIKKAIWSALVLQRSGVPETVGGAEGWLVHVRVVHAVSVPIVKGGAPFPGPLAPVFRVLGADQGHVRVGDLAQAQAEQFGGIQAQVRVLEVVPHPVDPHPRVVAVLGHAPGEDAAGHGPGAEGLAADPDFLVVAVEDPAAPYQAVLENDRAGGAGIGDAGDVGEGVVGGETVALEPHGDVVDVDESAFPEERCPGGFGSRVRRCGTAFCSGQGLDAEQEGQGGEQVGEFFCHRTWAGALPGTKNAAQISRTMGRGGYLEGAGAPLTLGGGMSTLGFCLGLK